MHHCHALTYYRGRWPDEQVSDGEPTWFLYEVDYPQDTVLRSVDIYAEGHATRNSVELEQQGGGYCPSLIDCSINEAFSNSFVVEVTAQEFEDAWGKAVDKPFWFTR